MRRLLTIAAWLLAALLAAPFVALAAFDIAVFQPRMPEIRSFLAQAAPEERSPPPSLLRVVRASHPHHFSGQVARLLVQKLNAYPTEGGMLRWHATGGAWWTMVALHLSEQEQVTLFLALSFMRNGVSGFANAAPKLVGTPLDSVSLEQAARLVVIAKAPTHFLDNPERLARLSAELAARARDAL
jgi:Transglycosylase